MSWREFSYYISGLSGETPLGRIISIRAEKNPETLKTFTPEERRIRTEYMRKQAKNKTAKEVDDAMNQIKAAFVAMSK